MSIGKTDGSTIAAIATSRGSGGVGIVKVSGPRAIEIARKIFFPPGDREVSKEKTSGLHQTSFESHRAYYGHIIEPQSGIIIDEVLLTAMVAPRSYTREDVVEVSAHGGQVVLQTILELLTTYGARLAEPGEFTYRAFLNGRIDLTQAEAVIDLVNAKNRSARQIAVNQIDGNLRFAIESVRAVLLEMSAQIEAAIDFPDDVEEDVGSLFFQHELQARVVSPLEKICANYRNAHVLRDGITALIVGRPNVGKSSLLNRLVKMDRAIVTDIPGTTRDYIEEIFHLNGTAVTVIDTAGFQDTDDPIERVGIQKTKELINGADVILFVVDARRPVGGDEQVIFELVKEKNLIIVQNKRDLIGSNDPEALPEDWSGSAHINVSAKTGEKIAELQVLIQGICGPLGDGHFEDEIVPNLRQVRHLDTAMQNARQAAASLEQGLSSELIAIDLQEALQALNECLGLSVKEDILEEIFRRFCIGK